jgi:hypothetical protein
MVFVVMTVAYLGHVEQFKFRSRDVETCEGNRAYVTRLVESQVTDSRVSYSCEVEDAAH